MFSSILNFITTHWAALSLGALLASAAGWVAAWVDSKGSKFVVEELEKLRTKANENSVLAQIACDDAIIDILERTIPDVLHELDEKTQKALAAGSITAVDWKQFGSDLWHIAKDDIVGGANDYLKNSSYNDGRTIAEIIAKRFFVTQKVQQAGLIVDPPRSGDVAPVANNETIPAPANK